MAEDTTEVARQIRELRKRVVRADRALICCRSGESRMLQDVLRITNEVIGAIANATDDNDLALVPAPALIGLQTRLVAVSAGAPLAVGAIVLASGVQMRSWAQQLGALEALEFFSTAIGAATAQRKSSCYECIKKQVLSQSADRKYATERLRRRV